MVPKLLDLAPVTARRYLRPPMTRFDIVATRGEIDESVHRISAVVTDADGRLVASAGTSELVTYFRSAAKPFQLWPLVRDGGVARFGLDPEMLALACGSHNAEPAHRAVGARWLAKVGLTEADLSCGGHPSLSSRVAREMVRGDVVPTPLWSNCSGKHAALLALAQLHGWPLAGYTKLGHPVQDEVASSMARWSGVPVSALQWGEDGCTAAAVAMPLTGIATAWARLGTSDEPAMATIRGAMLAHPTMIAGSDRLDTVLMETWPGRVLAKVGADGVYGAALPTLGLGIGLKVEDGHFPSAGHALMAILAALTARCDPRGEWPMEQLAPWRTPPILNTRGAPVGAVAVRGGLTFA
jgi:L-asparaginase II